ncbi:hypothetical protein ABZ479_32910 [Streptomyces sp. NPDC005722]
MTSTAMSSRWGDDGVEDDVRHRLGIEPVVEGAAGRRPRSFQSGFQRQARPFDHAVADHDQRGALQGEGLLRVVDIGQDSQDRPAA